MRPAIVATVLLVGLTAAGCGGKKKPSVFETAGKCPPPISTASAGNTQVSARAVGKGATRRIVIHATDKTSGRPLDGGSVTVQAEMTCPHHMGPFIEKKLHETSDGTYQGLYSLFMPGHWDVHITVRTKTGDATTSGLPVDQKRVG